MIFKVPIIICFPPFGVARVNNCDTQGKVTRERREKKGTHTYFKKK